MTSYPQQYWEVHDPRWSDNPQPWQTTFQSETPKSGMTLEEMVRSLAESTLQFQQETKMSIRNLENQVSQISTSLSKLASQGKLLSQTEINPQQSTCAIIVNDREKVINGLEILDSDVALDSKVIVEMEFDDETDKLDMYDDMKSPHDSNSIFIVDMIDTLVEKALPMQVEDNLNVTLIANLNQELVLVLKNDIVVETNLQDVVKEPERLKVLRLEHKSYILYVSDLKFLPFVMQAHERRPPPEPPPLVDHGVSSPRH